METTIRAKFRCLSITHSWNGDTLVKLGPIKRGNGKDPENEFFWKFTPSGEAELSFPKGKTAPFKPGAFYHVDMQRADKAPWRLSSLEQADYATNVGLYCPEDAELGASWGSLKMGLSVEATGARAAMQPHGSHWNVRFTFAEESDA